MSELKDHILFSYLTVYNYSVTIPLILMPLTTTSTNITCLVLALDLSRVSNFGHMGYSTARETKVANKQNTMYLTEIILVFPSACVIHVCFHIVTLSRICEFWSHSQHGQQKLQITECVQVYKPICKPICSNFHFIHFTDIIDQNICTCAAHGVQSIKVLKVRLCFQQT